MPYLPRAIPKKRDIPKGRHLVEGRNPYMSKAWAQARIQCLGKQPLCVRCFCYKRITTATVADHITPWKGDITLFYEGALQSLCHACHSWKTTQESKGRYYYWKEYLEAFHGA